MPYTVPVSFDKFRENIELAGDHREIAAARRDRIVSLLKSNLTILDAFPTGSIAKFTAVKGHADLDVMVVLHYGNHCKDKRPSEVLQTVRDCC
jgi:tRNA nucleotidyltransferase (CCA-adding enzyme)